jgi:hypothetical protein
MWACVAAAVDFSVSVHVPMQHSRQQSCRLLTETFLRLVHGCARYHIVHAKPALAMSACLIRCMLWLLLHTHVVEGAVRLIADARLCGLLFAGARRRAAFVHRPAGADTGHTGQDTRCLPRCICMTHGAYVLYRIVALPPPMLMLSRCLLDACAA